MPGSPTRAHHPVYRRLLAGGPEGLRLRRADKLLVAGSAGAVLAVAFLAPQTAAPGGPARVLCAAAVLATALLTAVLGARWLGRRVGLLAGLVYASAAGVALAAQGTSPADCLFALCACAAMGAFGLGNTAGRLPLRSDRGVAWGFFAATGLCAALAGPIGPLVVFSAGLTALYLGQDPRGLRFLADPVGWAILGTVAAGTLVCVCLLRAPDAPAAWALLGHAALNGAYATHQSAPHAAHVLVRLALPWAPLTLLALGLGVLRAYWHLPEWRLFGSWAAAPLAWMGIGLCSACPAVATAMPPLAVTAAAGLNAAGAWARRGGKRRIATAAAAWLGACAALAPVLGQHEGVSLGNAVLACAAAGAVGIAGLLRLPARRDPRAGAARAGPPFFVVRPSQAAQKPRAQTPAPSGRGLG